MTRFLVAVAGMVLMVTAVGGSESVPLPEVHHGSPGPEPTKGRSPRPDERRMYGLGEVSWRITDESQDWTYNCLGFAMSSLIFGIREFPGERSMYMGNSDSFFTNLGWTVSADCRPKPGFRKVAVYCHPGLNQRVDPGDEVYHFAKQYRDDWWESKMGMNTVAGGQEPPRILHPGVDSIRGYGGGRACRCYEMSLSQLIEYIKTRVLPEIERLRKAYGNSTPPYDRAEREANARIRELQDAVKTEGPGN